ncbi:Casein kinase II regulatory subunit family protein [Histomonas meleagridis]|uniref:Casein kinase II regulatory subunit family protein n=1 Tax=Histomonas meleagridis TaxID=135588 RepID=UPI003559E3ED|nr:Casein kinase II regulatory subunit family protein [Histomonas meleagridis]KAH0804457.1 Casein kinase II regulatory subunit family protein [Histomonas meleagridis]
MTRWLDVFLESPKASLFVRVDNEFISNSFNLFGLKPQIDNFNQALELIKKGPADSNIDPDIERDAMNLYGLLHARFLLTKNGIRLMLEKYQRNEFQQCPRVYCKGIRCLPYGVSAKVGSHSVKMFCPNCHDVYNSVDRQHHTIDGAFFGPSWVHMFMHTCQHLFPKIEQRVYVPKIFGFKIYHPGDSESESDFEEESY